MQSPNIGTASTAAVWIGAAVASALGATILFDAWPGINWGIWVAVASGAVIFARTRSGKPVDIPVFILLAWATVLAFGLAATDSDFIQVLIVLCDAMLLGLAVLVTGTSSWSSLSAGSLPTIPFLAPLRVWSASGREISAAPKHISSPRARSIVRGLLLTLPIIIVLIALLRNADPVIAWTADHLVDLLPRWSVPGRLVFFLLLLSLTLGANSISARQAEAQVPALPEVGTGTIGATEQKIVLVAVAVILWIFVLLQITYLFHSPPGAIGSGVTFAEYARSGFAQLSFAVTIVGAIVLVLESRRPSDVDPEARRSLVRLETALLIALELILLSAFRRVILYEQAYGFTTDRLFAQAYMVVMAVALVLLWLEIRNGSISIALGRRIAVIALGVFTLWVFWNPEAWTVNKNIDRSHASGKFDSDYAIRLSRDAVPTLLARRSELPVVEQGKVDAWLACTRLPAHRRWFEWNRSVAAAARAMSGLSRVPCPTPRSSPAGTAAIES
jgi:F0F1-type ATP synthase assembly protein I